MNTSRRYSMRLVAAVASAVSLLMSAPVPAADGQAALLSALRGGGHVALIRHAAAPGTGDPSHFSLSDCMTQRNLSEEGRSQALKIGLQLRANGIPAARVYSSQWCRCLDTARLTGMGKVNELPILNSFFQHSERGSSQNQALKKWLARQKLDQPLLLVTHQVNITAISGVYPSPGEIVVMRRMNNGELSVVGNIKSDLESITAGHPEHMQPALPMKRKTFEVEIQAARASTT